MLTQMTESRGHKGKRKSQPLQLHPCPQKEHSSLRGKFYKGLLAVATIAGGLAAAFFFLPRVVIDASGPYDPSSPSPLIFTIANTNIVPLREVQPSIGVCFLSFAHENKVTRPCNGPSASRLAFGPWFIKWLDVDEKYQIAIEDALTNSFNKQKQIESANLTIAITYTPCRMPGFWRITKEFRFITKQLSDGKIYWVPTPLNT
jgi:hypothetical protein